MIGYRYMNVYQHEIQYKPESVHIMQIKNDMNIILYFDIYINMEYKNT